MRRRAARAGDEGQAAEAPVSSVEQSSKGMRMAELCAQSGVARETIHFYLREGLLPRPEKGGRTVAYYGEAHLERLRLIRHLREDKYLPIAVIRRLLDSAAAERDLDVLADVLHILPSSDHVGRAPSAEARAVAADLGLLGPARGPRDPHGDPAARRVLEVVDQALALDEETRRLTLADLESCAGALTALVDREAALFFDAMFQSGDVGGSIRALLGGRGAVARYIAAYRDLLLRRIVDEVLVGLAHGPELVMRTATIPLSARRMDELGVAARRDALTAEWEARRDQVANGQGHGAHGGVVGGEDAIEVPALLLPARAAEDGEHERERHGGEDGVDDRHGQIAVAIGAALGGGVVAEVAEHPRRPLLGVEGEHRHAPRQIAERAALELALEHGAEARDAPVQGREPEEEAAELPELERGAAEGRPPQIAERAERHRGEGAELGGEGGLLPEGHALVEDDVDLIERSGDVARGHVLVEGRGVAIHEADRVGEDLLHVGAAAARAEAHGQVERHQRAVGGAREHVRLRQHARRSPLAERALEPREHVDVEHGRRPAVEGDDPEHDSPLISRRAARSSWARSR